MRILILVVFVIMINSILYAQSGKDVLSGIVYLDKNNNGILDQKEHGLKNIPVLIGDSIVLTNRNGNFCYRRSQQLCVLPIITSGYQLNVENMLRQRDKQNSRVRNMAFPLVHSPLKSNFRIAAIGDLQVGNLEEVNYANRTLFNELAQRSDIDFNIFLGDLVNDNTYLFPVVGAMLKTLSAPSKLVFGNHDRDLNSVRQDSTFTDHFGPTNYAFNCGDVHFIVLNNVWSNGGRGYKGCFTDRQLRFVKNDLKLVEEQKLVVICQHIPLAYAKNKGDLLDLLKHREKVLVLSGHTHQVSRHQLAPNVIELVTGAACGNWWVGEKDFHGIPSGLMQGGTPRNYFIIDFNRNDYRITYKGIGLDEKHAMNIWVHGQDSVDSRIAAFNTDSLHVIANIYAGSDSTHVRMQIDSGEWIGMVKTKRIAPLVRRMLEMNKSGTYPSSISRKAALRRRTSSHIWVGELPENLCSGVHRIQIFAEDKYGFEAHGVHIFNKN